MQLTTTISTLKRFLHTELAILITQNIMQIKPALVKFTMNEYSLSFFRHYMENCEAETCSFKFNGEQLALVVGDSEVTLDLGEYIYVPSVQEYVYKASEICKIMDDLLVYKNDLSEFWITKEFTKISLNHCGDVREFVIMHVF